MHGHHLQEQQFQKYQHSIATGRTCT
jgi:hypothetical protein